MEKAMDQAGAKNVITWDSNGITCSATFPNGDLNGAVAELREGDAFVFVELRRCPEHDGDEPGYRPADRLGMDADRVPYVTLWWVDGLAYVAEELDPNSDAAARAVESADADPGFALDADGVTDVTEGEQLLTSYATGQEESFPARLGVRYEHEHLAYLVSIEDVEGNVNELWVEAGAFLAMCRRMLGEYVPAGETREVAPGTTPLDPDIDPDGIMAMCNSCDELTDYCTCGDILVACRVCGSESTTEAHWDHAVGTHVAAFSCSPEHAAMVEAMRDASGRLEAVPYAKGARE